MKHIIKFDWILMIALYFLFFTAVVSALSQAEIQYPVVELGGCKNQVECKTFCDKPENLENCIDFAEKNNLMNEKELEQAKKFVQAGSKGPGDCTSQDSCEIYCNNIEHLDECLAFAEANDIMPQEELEEARNLQAALKQGIKLPGNCKNKKECDVYCNAAEHMEECITFADTAGLIPPDELEEAQKALQAIKKGAKPPPCRGKKQCDEYCSEPENFEQCITFAEAAGFIPPEELNDAKKSLEAIKKGVKPPKCRGREECDIYCAQEEHTKECIDFAEAAGFMSQEQAEMARKTGGKGPGGCKGEEECNAFCENSDNEEICFQFGLEYGLIPEEDLERMKEGQEQMQEALEEAPPEVLDCLSSAFGVEVFEQIKTGAKMPSRKIGDTMQKCFESFQEEMIREEPGDFPGTIPNGEGEIPAGDIMNLLDALPPQVTECVKSVVGLEAFEEIQERSAPTFNLGQVVQKCLGPVYEKQPRTEGPEVCAQVITFAQNPQTGECRDFPTPCAVPPDWISWAPDCGAPQFLEPPPSELPPEFFQPSSQFEPPPEPPPSQEGGGNLFQIIKNFFLKLLK